MDVLWEVQPWVVRMWYDMLKSSRRQERTRAKRKAPYMILKLNRNFRRPLYVDSGDPLSSSGWLVVKDGQGWLFNLELHVSLHFQIVSVLPFWKEKADVLARNRTFQRYWDFGWYYHSSLCVWDKPFCQQKPYDVFGKESEDKFSAPWQTQVTKRP